MGDRNRGLVYQWSTQLRICGESLVMEGWDSGVVVPGDKERKVIGLEGRFV